MFAPLLAFPLLLRPELAIAASFAGAMSYLAWRSVAFPVALIGLPTIVIGLLGSNPFPEGAVALFIFAWIAFAIFLRILGEEGALPMRLLFAGPVVLTIALAGWMLLRLGASPAEEYGSLKFKLFLTGNVVLLVAAILIGRTRKHFDLFVGVVLAVATASALVLVRNLVSGTAEPVIGGGRFAISPEENPIHLGRGAAQGLVIAVFLLLAGSSRARGFAAVALPLVAVSLVAAGSRGPVLGLVASLLVLLAILLRDKAGRRRLGLVAGGLLAAALLIPQLLPGGGGGRALSVLTGQGTGLSSNGRFELWQAAWAAFTENPLFGLGTGGFASVAPVELYPHSILLETAAELGILGLLFVAGIIVSGVLYGARAARRAGAEDRRHAALALALLAAAVVNALFSGDIQTNSSVWLSVGLCVGLGVRETTRVSTAEQILRMRIRRPKPEVARPAFAAAATKARPAVPGRLAAGIVRSTGAITSPAAGAAVRGHVRVAAAPAETGWGMASIAIECAGPDGEWRQIAVARDDALDLYLARDRGDRQHVAVVRTQELAELMRELLERTAGASVQVEAAQRRPWRSSGTQGVTWETEELPGGAYSLRALTTDIAGSRIASPEIVVTVDNDMPEVSLTEPEDGTYLSGDVRLAASAADAGSGVAHVRFEAAAPGGDWSEAATAEGAPFVAVWGTRATPDGEYRLRAVAQDHAGNETVSAPVAVHLSRTSAPIVLVDPGASLRREVELVATVATVPANAYVDFQHAAAGSTSWTTFGKAVREPFRATLDTTALPDGAYDLRAVLNDPAGTRAAVTTLSDRVVDNTPPEAAIVEPPSGSVVAGDATIVADVADATSGVASVLFQFADASERWRPVVGERLGAAAVTWSSSRLPDGAYALRAIVVDGAGNMQTSPLSTVMVDNTAPSVVIVEPAPGQSVAHRISLRADALDAGSGLATVAFFYSHAGEEWRAIAGDGEGAAATWDTQQLEPGEYWLCAVATDRAGWTATSEPVFVRVERSEGPPPAAMPAVEPAPVDPGPTAPPGRWTLAELDRRVDAGGEDDPYVTDERRALVDLLRGYANPDGTIPEQFDAVVAETFGEPLDP